MTAPQRPAEAGHLLVVEDDPDVARLLHTVLRDFGFSVQTCRTAAELRQRIVREAPDLCIIDLGLPDADGMELVQELQRRHDCGVLILTGRAWLGDRVMGLELGADDYVTKPFEPRELVARVRSILRRRQGSPVAGHSPASGTGASSQAAHFSGWHFTPQTHALRAPGGQEWILSAGEAKVLTIFLQRNQRILTREQIAGDPDLSPLDRSIDVRISRLRRKLESAPATPKLIRTVYGAGYLLASEVRWE